MGLMDDVGGALAGGLMDPRYAALLGLSQGLMASGAPSRMPVPTAPALAGGIAGAAEGVKGAQALRAQQLQNQLQNLILGRTQLQLDVMNEPDAPAQGGLMGGGQPQQAQQQPAASLMSGANGMAVTSGVDPAAAAGPGASPMGGVPGYADPRAMFERGRRYTMAGIPGGKDLMDAALKLDPTIAAMQPTDLVKTLIQAGVRPGTPQWNDAMQAQITKMNEPTPLRAGSIIPDGKGGFMAMPGMSPAGSIPQFDPTSKSWSLAPMAGGLPTVAASQQAETAGKIAATPQIAYDKNGNQTWTFLNPPVPGQPPQGGAPAPSAPGSTPPAVPPVLAAPRVGAPKPPAPAAAGNAPWTPPYGTASTLRPGLGSGEAKDIERGNNYLAAARDDAQGVGVYRSLLDEAMRLASDPKVKFGPGTPELAELKAKASNIPGIDLRDAQTAQDVMAKISNQIATTQLGVGGTGSDKQLDALLHANPNGEMTNDAIKKVIPMLQGQLDLKENRAMLLQHIADSTRHQGNVPSALTTYNRLADPATIQLGNALHQAQASGTLKQLLATMTPAQRAVLPKVQQLDAMGAF